MSASLSERSQQWTLSERRCSSSASDDDGGGSTARCASSSQRVHVRCSRSAHVAEAVAKWTEHSKSSSTRRDFLGFALHLGLKIGPSVRVALHLAICDFILQQPLQPMQSVSNLGLRRFLAPGAQ